MSFLSLLTWLATELPVQAGRQETTGPAPAAVVRDLAADESDVLDRAEQFLIRDCMRRHGFAYTIVSHTQRAEDRDFPYVIDNVGWAGRHGYGTDLLREREAAIRAEPNTVRLNGMTPSARAAALAALNGVSDPHTDLSAVLPSGITTRRSSISCTSEAQRALYADLPTWYRVSRVTENLAPERIGLVLADARYQRAVAGWSRCLAHAGHAYDSPGEARDAVLSADPPMPRPKETALAVAEATCAGRTGLAATVRELDRQHAEEINQRYAADLADRRRLRHDALPRANAVILAG
ncbi:hypothetical protein AB0M54_29655 [Actinoplanes sp. NPDC051470]|uniref:hypothetical protein n=1 Tax=unclassified Actinoplanes TaxID=2626549 RepID=UPI00341ECDBB